MKFRHQAQYTVDHEITPAYFQSFLTHWEGVEGFPDNNNLSEIDQILMNIEIEDDPYEHYLTELGEINGAQIVAILND